MTKTELMMEVAELRKEAEKDHFRITLLTALAVIGWTSTVLLMMITPV